MVAWKVQTDRKMNLFMYLCLLGIYVCVKTRIHSFIYIINLIIFALVYGFNRKLWFYYLAWTQRSGYKPSSLFHRHFVPFLTCKSVKSQVLPWLMKPLRLVWCCNKIWNWIKLPPPLVEPVHQQQAATKEERRSGTKKRFHTQRHVYFTFIKTSRMVMISWDHHGNQLFFFEWRRIFSSCHHLLPV